MRVPYCGVGASLHALFSDVAFPAIDPPTDDVATVGALDHDATEGTNLPTSSSEASKKDKVSV